MSGELLVQPSVPPEPCYCEPLGTGSVCMAFHGPRAYRVIWSDREMTGAVWRCTCGQCWRSDGRAWEPISTRRAMRIARRIERDQRDQLPHAAGMRDNDEHTR